MGRSNFLAKTRYSGIFVPSLLKIPYSPSVQVNRVAKKDKIIIRFRCTSTTILVVHGISTKNYCYEKAKETGFFERHSGLVTGFDAGDGCLACLIYSGRHIEIDSGCCRQFRRDDGLSFARCFYCSRLFLHLPPAPQKRVVCSAYYECFCFCPGHC